MLWVVSCWLLVFIYMLQKIVGAGHFQEGRYREGLVEGIGVLGGQLAAHFPYREDDVDELSDEVRFG